jgi:hypothetical protein
MNKQTMSRALRSASLIALLVFLLAPATRSQEKPKQGEDFSSLKPAVEIIYLLANSSVIMGPDIKGKSEEITFVGTVHVPKFPLSGYDRRKLPSGRFQIDFELTRSELRGESYLLHGPVLLGEHPELRSLGTITQKQAGTDYPADFIVMRKVLIQTPKGTMYNEDPVPVTGTIDAIPPVVGSKTVSGYNVFRGKELPIAMLDTDGQLSGWFYSKAHVAYAVEPEAIYRANASGRIEVRANGQKETVVLSGPIEFVNRAMPGNTKAIELVMMALRGESRLLGGMVMVTEAFDPKEKFSTGSFGMEGEKGADGKFNLFLEIKSPSGTLAVTTPISVNGKAVGPERIAEVALSKGNVPVFNLKFDFSGGGDHPILNEAGKEVGAITHFDLSSRPLSELQLPASVGRRPCCPKPVSNKH